ncbi:MULTISPECIES: peptidase U32 family protein [Reichenbachiella]|uniref:Putative protease n=1 Tax=Reichenbachiella agariperforans TaxID=156994 RepID=A0A1M6LPU2_REIAG|nr:MULTISPECIES: peptidase U32 family protein [Reichenbachiella]MBU2914008.1 U32 family peptidase [Reichenbachiella agariperforans]RJE74084.1 collagenase [Reichenbachiella sp. MSK19-1]SHJ73203.1 putative protease [Reichenbachiella agariperforans]
MSTQQHDIEIMAPAGSYESLMAAIKGGANSIYFGVEQLNMRARSSNNFTLEDLKKIANICDENGLKSYITMNTVMYDHDMNLMRSIVDAAKESGISAIIAADHSVMNYAKKIGFPIHISTQANISNIETVEFYSVYADVMVMARELSLMQVADITREIKKRDIRGPKGELVRIEVFAHGALCMAVSGKCYLSLHSDFSSANRGACVQNCRREYTVKDDRGNELKIDNEYIMSAADLCTIDFMDKVVEAGVSVFKIEGRGRAADYVYTTTKCYRDAGDAINEGTYTPEKFTQWKLDLEKVYNRGFWDGYYLGRKMGEWSEVHGSKATTKKILLGKGVKYFSKLGVGEFQMETHTLESGDDIMITGPTTGIVTTKVGEMRVANQPVSQVKKGDNFSIAIEETIRASDKLYKIIPA